LLAGFFDHLFHLRGAAGQVVATQLACHGQFFVDQGLGLVGPCTVANKGGKAGKGGKGGKGSTRGGNPLKCMALNIYFESRGEPEEGQVGVGMVTLNRAQSGKFQPTVCGVVYAKSQFSWTFDKHSDVPQPGPIWDRSVKLAKQVLARALPDPTKTASHFFNPKKVRPNWAKKFKFTARLGDHDFYRMPGFAPKGTEQGKTTKLSMAQVELTADDFYDVSEFEAFTQEQNWRPETADAGDQANYQAFLEFVDSLPDVEGAEDGSVPTEDSSNLDGQQNLRWENQNNQNPLIQL
jgi:hypothetical protein